MDVPEEGEEGYVSWLSIPIPTSIPQNLYGAIYKQNSAKGA